MGDFEIPDWVLQNYAKMIANKIKQRLVTIIGEGYDN